jgi:iron complex transport system permease protein
MIKWIIPFAIIGIIMALILSESITVLSLGEEIAIGLGQNIKKNKILISLTVIILSGISVAMAGKISFIGLMIPHITKYFVGHDYKKIIPISGLIGGFFLIRSRCFEQIFKLSF